MASRMSREENDVFIDAEEAEKETLNQVGVVKKVLQLMEEGGSQRQNPHKRSRESVSSVDESALVSKFEEVISLIKRENLSHREAFLADMKREFASMAKEIESKLDAVRERLEKRVEELEVHVSQRDDLVVQLQDEVAASRQTITKLENDLEQQEMASKAAELVLSGGAVPAAPRPGAASAGRRGPPGSPPELYLRETARDVILRAFPRVDLDPRDLADVRRIGARVLLCRFVHTGPGSARHYLYENRLTLTAIGTMPLTDAEMKAACTEPDPATKDFHMQHTMLRVKDPKVSLDFYTRVLGMRLLKRVDLTSAKLTLFLMGYEAGDEVPSDEAERTRWCFGRRAVVELTHAWGTEDDPSFGGYCSGNAEPGKGFGHIALHVPDLEAACARLERLGVTFVVKPNQGLVKGMAFVKDPDGYWIEILNSAGITAGFAAL